MSLTSEPAPNPSPTGSMTVTQLLPDGRLLWTSGLQTYLLSPDANGSYADGVWVEVDPTPYYHLYSVCAILNDGRYVTFPSTYGSSHANNSPNGRNYTSVFDPATDSWSSIEGQYVGSSASRITKGMEGHAPGFVADDGRQFNGRQGVPIRVEDDTFSAPWDAVESAETPWITMPDGSAVEISPSGFVGGSWVGLRFRRFTPNYSAEFVAAGSRSGPSYAEVDLTEQLLTAIDTSPVNMRWRLPSDPALRARYTSVGPTIKYEVGASFWMPKINKVVVITGWGGILTMNQDGTGIALAARLPNIRQFAWGSPSSIPMNALQEPEPLGTIRSVDNGRGVQSGGTFVIEVGNFTQAQSLDWIGGNHPANQWPPSGLTQPLQATRSIHIALAGNTRWVRYTFDTISISGSLLTISGCVPVEGDINGTLATGDLVTFGRPGLEPMDAPAAFLPNGDVVFLAGTKRQYHNGDFNSGCVTLKWDGVSQEAQYLTTPSRDCHLGTVEFRTIPHMLPDGTMLLVSSGLVFQYTPTESERTPLTGSRPAIVDIPSTVSAGGRFTLVGTQLNGRHEGTTFGDDFTPRTNFPIVRFRNASSGRVYYCRTRDFTYRGIAANRQSACRVDVPASVPPGTYEVEVVTHGVPCATPSIVTVTGAAGDPIFIPYR
jgi:hypothetical protein